jgi:hypothetical protein
MLGGDVAERAVVVDDPQPAVAALGVRSESLGGQGVGDGLHRRAQRPPPGCEPVAGEALGHRPAVLLADLLGDHLRLVGRQAVERPAEERQQQVVAADRGTRVDRTRAADGDVPLRRPSRRRRRPPCR